MKKTIAIAISVALVFFVAGCNSKNNTSSQNESSQIASSNTQTVVSTSSKEQTTSKIEIGEKPVLVSAFAEYENGKPKLIFKNLEGRQDYYAELIIKDSSGQIVEHTTGIKKDSYTVSATLYKGEKYSVEINCVPAYGEKTFFCGNLQKQYFLYAFRFIKG